MADEAAEALRLQRAHAAALQPEDFGLAAGAGEEEAGSSEEDEEDEEEAATLGRRAQQAR